MQISSNITPKTLLSITTLILIFSIVTSLIKSKNFDHSENRLIKTIEKYQQLGLLESDLISDETHRFRLSLATLDYSEEKTFSVVQSELRMHQSMVSQQTSNVENMLSFKEYTNKIRCLPSLKTEFCCCSPVKC